jgi:hypothetical protein
LVQIARERASTRVAHLPEFGVERRYATLVATVLDTATIVTDESKIYFENRFLDIIRGGSVLRI